MDAVGGGEACGGGQGAVGLDGFAGVGIGGGEELCFDGGFGLEVDVVSEDAAGVESELGGVA